LRFPGGCAEVAAALGVAGSVADERLPALVVLVPRLRTVFVEEVDRGDPIPPPAAKAHRPRGPAAVPVGAAGESEIVLGKLADERHVDAAGSRESPASA
jgi:hypothetical protein